MHERLLGPSERDIAIIKNRRLDSHPAKVMLTTRSVDVLTGHSIRANAYPFNTPNNPNHNGGSGGGGDVSAQPPAINGPEESCDSTTTIADMERILYDGGRHMPFARIPIYALEYAAILAFDAYMIGMFAFDFKKQAIVEHTTTIHTVSRLLLHRQIPASPKILVAGFSFVLLLDGVTYTCPSFLWALYHWIAAMHDNPKLGRLVGYLRHTLEIEDVWTHDHSAE